MKFLFAIVVILLTSICLSGKSVESFEPAKFRQSFDKLVQALNEHKISYLKPKLADDFKIEGVPDNYAIEVIRQFVQAYPSSISGYQIGEVKNHLSGYKVTVKVMMEDTIKDYDYVVNESYQFLEINMFRTIQAAPDEDISNLNSMPDYLELPFIDKDGMIIIRGILDGVEGNFILDTGAPRLIINSEPSYQGESISLGSSGVNGALTGLDIKHLNSFQFGEIVRKDFDALTADLSALQKELSINVLGLIGQSQIRDFELYIDYSSKMIKLYRLDESGNITGGTKPDPPRFKTNFDLALHIPIIKCKIGKQEVNFGLDTGAQVNLINESDSLKFQSYYIETSIDTLLGADNNSREVGVGELTGLSIEEMTFQPMRTLVSDISHINEASDRHMDGILGYELFKFQPISINYIKQSISFY